VQKTLAAVRELLADHRLLEAEEAAALAERRAEIEKWEAAEAELLAVDEAPDEAGDEEGDVSPKWDPPERTAPAKPRVPAVAPPPTKPAGSGKPACLAGLRDAGLDSVKKIAQALAAGRTHQGAILDRTGLSQPTVHKFLARMGHTLPPAERLFERVSHGMYELTALGRRELLG
jgi:hypothetical protein